MKILILILVLFSACINFLAAQQIESEILLSKMDRLYFPVGEEAGLYIGAPFDIVCEGDTVTSGIIDFIGPGISYSRSQTELREIGSTGICIAVIKTIGVDSSAVIELGTDLPLTYFNLELETLFIRQKDTVVPNLLDSAVVLGNRMDLFLPPDSPSN